MLVHCFLQALLCSLNGESRKGSMCSTQGLLPQEDISTEGADEPDWRSEGIETAVMSSSTGIHLEKLPGV